MGSPEAIDMAHRSEGAAATKFRIFKYPVWGYAEQSDKKYNNGSLP
jgi:hypothetical protein